MDFITTYSPPSKFNSPADHILDKDRLLSAEETALIKASICKANEHVFLLEECSRHVQNEANRLHAERAALLNYRDLHAARIAPINRCPPEVLSEIFLWCLPDTVEDEDNWNTPACLSHVCTTWRNIATNGTPQLWSSIVMYRTGFIPTREQMGVWIRRAANRPLSVTISDFCSRLDLCHLQETLRNDFAGLLATSGRWRRLCLETGLLKDGMSCIGSHFPALKHLEFSWLQLDDASFRNFENAPELSSIHIRFHQGHMHNTLVLPWSNIKRLELTQSDLQLALSYLQRMHNLSTLFLTSCFDAQGTMDRIGHKVVDRNLRNLVMTTNHAHVYGPFMGQLVLPRLTKLSIDGKAYNPDCVSLNWEKMHASFTTFLSNSACALHTFHLVNTSISASHLVDLLALMPSLVNLRLGACATGGSSCGNTNEVIKRLTVYDQHTPVLSPALQSLTIHMDTPLNESDVVDMLKSRARPRCDERGVPLTVALCHVSLFLAHPMDGTTAAQLGEYGGSGLSVDVVNSASAGDVSPWASWHDDPIEN